jgi:ABC-type glycerol-3-phosphate transport system permease component
MRYCTNFGNLLGENDQFCPSCNSAVKPAEETPSHVIVREMRHPDSTYSIAGYKDNFWVSGLRGWGQLLFVLVLLAGAFAGYHAARLQMWGSNQHNIEALIIFLIVFAPIAIGGFLLVAFMMIIVEMASDIGKIRYMLENPKKYTNHG